MHNINYFYYWHVFSSSSNGALSKEIPDYKGKRKVISRLAVGPNKCKIEKVTTFFQAYSQMVTKIGGPSAAKHHEKWAPQACTST